MTDLLDRCFALMRRLSAPAAPEHPATRGRSAAPVGQHVNALADGDLAEGRRQAKQRHRAVQAEAVDHPGGGTPVGGAAARRTRGT
jgi:hypothetical protein